jgi:hypothetical protein
MSVFSNKTLSKNSKKQENTKLKDQHKIQRNLSDISAKTNEKTSILDKKVTTSFRKQPDVYIHQDRYLKPISSRKLMSILKSNKKAQKKVHKKAQKKVQKKVHKKAYKKVQKKHHKHQVMKSRKLLKKPTNFNKINKKKDVKLNLSPKKAKIQKTLQKPEKKLTKSNRKNQSMSKQKINNSFNKIQDSKKKSKTNYDPMLGNSKRVEDRKLSLQDKQLIKELESNKGKIIVEYENGRVGEFGGKKKDNKLQKNTENSILTKRKKERILNETKKTMYNYI